MNISQVIVLLQKLEKKYPNYRVKFTNTEEPLPCNVGSAKVNTAQKYIELTH